MAFHKKTYLLVILLGCALSMPYSTCAQTTMLHQSVEAALRYSPQLKALSYTHEAIGYDLLQSQGGYRPSVDVIMGYGLEQYSDEVTRAPGADPSDTDWDTRGDASIRLTQRLYDGGETRQHISIQQARLDSAQLRVKDATHTVALNAIIAHLEVYRQRELVRLAEKNLQVHEDIYHSLAERERAGAGNIADVTQTQARIARVQSNLSIIRSDLKAAIATYERVVGEKPGELSFAGVPQIMPQSLEEALRLTEERNPQLQALEANVLEADARLALARANYLPKINLELSSRYKDQVEGEGSWQHTNDALLVLHWNLYNGGKDKAGVSAALSRKSESQSNRDDKLIELREATAAAWAAYGSLEKQKRAYRSAVTYSQRTFDAYLKQFSVSQRDLLDVLSAENEYFQSASQLVTVAVNETIAAYRILRLGGELKVATHSALSDDPEGLKKLAEAIVFPSAPQTRALVSAVAYTSTNADPVQPPPVKIEPTEPASISQPAAPARVSELYLVKIGPCNHKPLLKKAHKVLDSHGIEAQSTEGTGTVRITRLLEGIYPTKEALKRLKALKETVETAFILKEGDQLALYAASSQDAKRASRYADRLAQKGIKVTPVEDEIEMQGNILMAQHLDKQSAEAISEEIGQLGLSAKIVAAESTH
jgi:adhesin transport system outer membrane protein